MTLIDERELAYEQEKRRKIFKTIITAIIVLIIIAILLLVFVKIKKASKLKVYVDGKENSSIGNTFLLKDEKGKIYEENDKIYISVRDLSTILNKQYYNSEYKKKGEDKTKCQILNGNEYASFISNTNRLYKAKVTENEVATNANKNTEFEEIPEKTSVEYEYFTLGNDVKYVNDTIYASAEDLELGFDIIISYDKKGKTITISTLDYLENVAKNSRNDVVDSSEYDYANKRLLKYGMCVVKNSNGELGVGSYTNKDKLSSYVASCKYSDLKFNEATQTIDVISTSDNKAGILKIDLQNQEVTKNITSAYSEMKVIDNNFQYFLVKSEDKYGMVNADGQVILQSAFDEIGVNEGLYTDITNKYIVNDKYIPAKKDGKWGLYSTDGKELIAPQFADFGCAVAQNGESVTVVPGDESKSDKVVFLYNKEKNLYGLYNADNGEKIAVSLTEVFKKADAGNEEYYINHVISKDKSTVHTLNVRTDL